MKNEVQLNRKEYGQSMIELAVAITFLMILVVGTLDLGRAFFTWLEMRDAAQEGASYGSICPNDENNVEARVRDNLNPNYTSFVNIQIPNPTIAHPITVTVDTRFPITTPLLGSILGTQTITITATINDSILSSICP
jgi:Flp pilus assembly protein TadG